MRPKNGVGYSLSVSNTVTVLTDGYPIYMNTPIGGAVTPTSISLSWTALTDMVKNSGDIPIYYRVEWYNRETDQYNPTWDEVSKESSGLRFEFTHGRTAAQGVFPSGSTQKYRIIAKNNVGLGVNPSAELEIVADEVPILMSTPTVTAVTPNSVSLSWTEITLPAQTGRDDVFYYHVKWQETATSWSYIT